MVDDLCDIKQSIINTVQLIATGLHLMHTFR